MSQSNKYQKILFIEVQLLLIAVLFIAYQTLSTDNKLKNTNKFIHGIFQDTQKELLREAAKDDIVIGDDEAPATIVVYMKYGCVPCQTFFQNTFPKLKEDYIDKGKLKLAIRYLANGQNSQLFYAIKMAHYTAANGKFLDYHEWLLQNDWNQIDTSTIRHKVLGLLPEESQLDAYMEKQEISRRISEKSLQARGVGIHKTPTFIIDDHIIVGARQYAFFENAIEAQLY